MTRGGRYCGKSATRGAGVLGGGVFVDPLWREVGDSGEGEILVVEGSVDYGDDGVLSRLGAAKSVGREEDRLVEGEVIDDHSFPLGLPICPFPLGDEEECVSFVLADFLQDAVEEGPRRVDVGVDEMPAVGKRVVVQGVGIVGLGGEVVV